MDKNNRSKKSSTIFVVASCALGFTSTILCCSAFANEIDDGATLLEVQDENLSLSLDGLVSVRIIRRFDPQKSLGKLLINLSNLTLIVSDEHGNRFAQLRPGDALTEENIPQSTHLLQLAIGAQTIKTITLQPGETLTIRGQETTFSRTIEP